MTSVEEYVEISLGTCSSVAGRDASDETYGQSTVSEPVETQRRINLMRIVEALLASSDGEEFLLVHQTCSFCKR